MKHNLYMYANPTSQQEAANSLVVFGIDIFKRAKVISEMEYLEEYINKGKTGGTYPPNPHIAEYLLEYLIDCVKILIFFENYMKAKLLLNDYCVHQIDGQISGFDALAKKQKKEPIKLLEIHKIEPFEISLTQNTFYHRAVKETTLSMNILINNQAYTQHYEFDIEILEIVRELNKTRNQLHFRDTIEMILSQSAIDKFKKLDDFVNILFRNGSEMALLHEHFLFG